MTSQPDPSATLGQYLLRGWAMLGDVCSVPDCNMPLMRSPDKSQKIMCVICDTKPAQSAKKEEPMKANTVPSVASTPSEVDVSTKSKEIATKPSPASQDPSDILGDYLLRGWVMMNDACPDCHSPIMRKKDRSMVQCVVCNESTIIPSATSSAITVPEPSNISLDQKPMDTAQTIPVEKIDSTCSSDHGEFSANCIKSIQSVVTKCMSQMEQYAARDCPDLVDRYLDITNKSLDLLQRLEARPS